MFQLVIDRPRPVDRGRIRGDADILARLWQDAQAGAQQTKATRQQRELPVTSTVKYAHD